jgi:hypothetical protein
VFADIVGWGFGNEAGDDHRDEREGPLRAEGYSIAFGFVQAGEDDDSAGQLAE